MPAATAKIAKMTTRNLFFALASMMRSISVGEGVLECWSVGVLFSITPSLPSPVTPFFERALHFRFGVDQEVCARDDALVFLQATLHLVDVAVLGAELDY